jgi:hypothetical protein
MTESELRAEIKRRAPHLEIIQAGSLFSRGLDAIVQDPRGQYLWSVYSRELNPQPIAEVPASPPLPGQKSLF